MNWWQASCQTVSQEHLQRAKQRQTELTKPPGALGRLEQVAIRLAGLQWRDRPAVDRVHISIFAADHGVVAEGVSAFPQAVTGQMVHNFLQGGAAISDWQWGRGWRLWIPGFWRPCCSNRVGDTARRGWYRQQCAGGRDVHRTAGIRLAGRL
ncbi:MAG: nicotinate-nucleotide--dimethylbenzimidazole phosphoribosyltransferase [Thiolinea sp.]